MSGFTKLDHEILRSTIWMENWQTKLTWITILAMMDKRNEVHSSVPGLAKEAGVPLEDCEAALLKMMQPDKHSRSKEFEGRRIAEIDGGWTVLNGDKYRKKYSLEWRREQDATRARERRARRSADSVQSVSGQESVHQSATIPATPAVVSGRHPRVVAQEMVEHKAEEEQMTFREGVGAPVVTLLCVGTGRSEFTVRESLAAEWGEAYPGVDVPTELRKAVQWCADNPTRRKTFRGARKFLSGWLARAQNTLPSKGNGRAQPIAAASSGCPEWDRILGAYHVRSPETEDQLFHAVTAAVEGGILRLTVPDEYRAQYVERHIADIRASSPIPVLIAVQPAEFAVPGEDLPF
jgi:hypothetical protein